MIFFGVCQYIFDKVQSCSIFICKMLAAVLYRMILFSYLLFVNEFSRYCKEEEAT